jgi:hypothetical protein
MLTTSTPRLSRANFHVISLTPLFIRSDHTLIVSPKKHYCLFSTDHPTFADVVGIVPPSCPITCDPPCALRNEDLENKDENAHPNVLRSDNDTSPDKTPVSSQATLLNDLPSIDPAHQTQFPAVQNAWVEETLPQSSINSSLNVPGISYDPAIATSGAFIWSPQQTLASPAAQNFTGFYSPSLMPPRNNIHNPSLIQPQLFHTPLPSGPSFNPPPPIPPQRTPCPLCTETFARPSDLNRHFQSVHLGIKYHCDYWLGCPNNRGKGYCRLEKLRTHQREKHGFTWS